MSQDLTGGKKRIRNSVREGLAIKGRAEEKKANVDRIFLKKNQNPTSQHT